MTKLAVDLGTRTGITFGIDATCMASEMWDLRTTRFVSPASRLATFVDKLDELHARLTITHVYFEAVRRHRGVDAAHWYGAFWGALTTWCDRHSIPYEGVEVAHIKKSFTGKGNATKEMMIAEAQRRGYETSDENEADSIALFLMKAG